MATQNMTMAISCSDLMCGRDVMCAQGPMVLVHNRHGPVRNCGGWRQDQLPGWARVQQPEDVEGPKREDEAVDEAIDDK
jgi:hypothetical protein